MSQTHLENLTIRIANITELDAKGRGVGETETGGKVFVPYTLPSERVEVIRRPRKQADLTQVLEASPHRVEGRCRHFMNCGGCAWQHIDPEYQLRLKRELVAKRFQLNGVDIDAQSIPIVSSPPFHYRNRMDFVWWYDGRFGLRRRGKWHSVVNLEECHLFPDDVMEVALEINRRVHDAGLPFRDEKRELRGLRYLIVRRGVFTGDLMVNFVTDPMELPSSLWDGLDRVTSVYQLINDNLKNDQSDGIPFHLAGADAYRERIGEHTFYVGPRSFFQPNPIVAESMIEHAGGILDLSGRTNRRLLDLYCGIGVFSICLADRFERGWGIELSDEAIAFAKRNVSDAPIEFFCQDAIDLPLDIVSQTNTLIVDPPREGLHPRVLKTLLAHPFRDIVYVSCKPAKGVEEIVTLMDRYSLRSIHLFDQFPQTPHVEMIVHLSS